MAMVLFWTLLWISGYCHSLSAESIFKSEIIVQSNGYFTLQPHVQDPPEDILWKWNENKVVDFDQFYKEVEYGQFKGRTVLDLTTGALTLTRLSEADSGEYVGELMIKGEELIHHWTVKVLDAVGKPAVTCQGKGSSVTLLCSGDDRPSSQYRWEGPDIEPQPGSRLEIEAAGSSDAVYTCVLYNPVSESRAELSVKSCFPAPHKLDVRSTYGTQHTLYKGILSSSEVVLICLNLGSYRNAYWKWEPLSGTNVSIVAPADKYDNASISMEVNKERFSSEGFVGSNFPLRISPVKFGDSGRYFCYSDAHSNPVATITLVTVQVSAVPLGCLCRNQSVVLNCEISQVIGSVTLAWLRMKGGRGELIKQEVLSKGHPTKMLSLTLPILSRDQLHWACAVFTESMLRAQVPLHLTLPTPITEPEETKPGWSTEIVVRVVIVVLATVGMIKFLMWYCRRRPASSAALSPHPHTPTYELALLRIEEGGEIDNQESTQPEE